MAKYFSKIVKLDGLIAVHWSKMKIGQEYIAVIRMPRIQKYYKGYKNKIISKKQYDDYYLIEQK